MSNQQDSQVFKTSSTLSRKRKRGQDEQVARHHTSQAQEQCSSEQSPASPSRHHKKKSSPQKSASDSGRDITNPLKYWVLTGRWRKEYFRQDSQVRKDFERGKSAEHCEQRDSLQRNRLREPFQKMRPFSYLQKFVSKTKLSASLRRKQSQSSLQASSDQLSREGKSSQYNSPGYEIKLEQQGSYLRDHADIDDNVDEEGSVKQICMTFLDGDQTVPQDTLFRDDLFGKICEKIRNRNEAIVVQDIARLIVPSAENLAIFGAKHLIHLYETASESWTSMAVYEGTLPQPDYSVGFGRSAFTREQLDKLKPFVGEPGSKLITYFMATMRMYFPFLTCEVKCGAGALDIADRQNAQSMSMALRALVVLFRSVKREKEVDRKPLTFSISHDHRTVRIYGHYPVMEGAATTFWRKQIHNFDITALDGRDKWTTYKFVKNVYDHHSLWLHKLICSGINDLPDEIDYDVSQSSTPSHSIVQGSQQSSLRLRSSAEDSQSSIIASQEVTPNTSFAQTEGPASKKPKK